MPRVYLAGPIASKDWDGANSWRRRVRKTLSQHQIVCVSPLRGKREYFPTNGTAITHQTDNYVDHPLTRAAGITGRDRHDIRTVDLMIANLLGATEKVCGTAIEFGWADAWRVPIILVMEREGSVADHPMLRQIAEFHVETLDEACDLARMILLP